MNLPLTQNLSLILAILLLTSVVSAQQLNNNLKVSFRSGTGANPVLDETVVFFIPGATHGFDFMFDGLKFGYTTNSIASHTKIDASKLVFNGLPVLPANSRDTIILDINFNTAASNYILSFDRINGFDSNITLLLHDRYTDTIHNLRDSASYYFATNSLPASRSQDRFELIFARNLAGEQPMPVQLTRFSGIADAGGNTVLTWETASEQNNRGFYVEVSTDGETFEQAGFVRGAGNSEVVRVYHFAHVITQKSYFRLKQVDFDGQEELSATIAVNRAVEERMTIYPNPSADVIQVNGGISSIEIFDLHGRQVHQQAVSDTERIPVNHLPAGVYYVIPDGQQGAAVKMIRK